MDSVRVLTTDLSRDEAQKILDVRVFQIPGMNFERGRSSKGRHTLYFTDDNEGLAHKTIQLCIKRSRSCPVKINVYPGHDEYERVRESLMKGIQTLVGRNVKCEENPETMEEPIHNPTPDLGWSREKPVWHWGQPGQWVWQPIDVPLAAEFLKSNYRRSKG